MSFDPNNPYEAAAMYFCFIICESCGCEPDFKDSNNRDLNFYHYLGQQAKEQNWYVMPNDGSDIDYTILCNNCFTKTDKKLPKQKFQIEAKDGLLKICSMVGISEN